LAAYPSVTIFAPYFPPRARVGAIRPYRFAKYLSEFGWQVSVICIADSSTQLSDLQKEEMKNVRLYNLAPPIDRTTKKKTTDSRNKAKNSKSVVNWLDSQFPIDTWLPFLASKRGEIEAILMENKTDILFSTSDPWSSAVMANKISSAMNIPWVADFRDPWTLCDTRFSTKGKVAKQIDERAERNIIKKADFVTYTSTATEDKYLKVYSDLGGKSATIRNSFDTNITEISENSARSDGKLIILFLGKFRALSTAESIITLLHYLKIQETDLFTNVEVHSYGELDDFDQKLATQKGVSDKFVVRETVHHSEVSSEIKKADVLLLSTKPERDDIIPAKLFDYLPSGKPILSLVENPEVKSILDETRTGIQTGSKDLDSALKFLKMINKGTKPTSSNLEKIKQYSAKYRAHELDVILQRVIENVR